MFFVEFSIFGLEIIVFIFVSFFVGLSGGVKCVRRVNRMSVGILGAIKWGFFDVCRVDLD